MLSILMDLLVKRSEFSCCLLIAFICAGCSPSDQSNPAATVTAITPTQPVETTLPSTYGAAICNRIRCQTFFQETPLPSIHFNHWEIVHDLAYSPDGQLLAVSAGDNVHIYDAASLVEKLDIPIGAGQTGWLSILTPVDRSGSKGRHPSNSGIHPRETWSANSPLMKKARTALAFIRMAIPLPPPERTSRQRLWDISSLETGECNIEEIGSFIGESFSSPDVAFAPMEDPLPWWIYPTSA